MSPESAAPAPAMELPRDLVDERLVRWYFFAALTFMLVSMLGGILVALQLVHWNPLGGLEIFSPGRWRMVHTNAIAYGFLANAFLGVLHWVVPRLTFHKVASQPLSYFIFCAWQAIVLLTAAGILIGPSLQDQPWVMHLAAKYKLPMGLGAQGLEWGETPFWIDPVALLGLALVAFNFLTPISKAKGPLYVTLWYFMAAFVWTFLTYAMGNLLPEYSVGGTSAGAIGGLFIHDLVGLFVTPLGWGLMYYFVPIILKKPIWSHGLSLIGFWGLAFFYPLQGIHHFLYTPIPMFLQYGAVVSTIAVELVVATVIINFFGTLWGREKLLYDNLPIRWFYTGMVLYFVTCFQCALQVTLTFQKLIHFSDWVVGHAHLVMFGVFSMWIFGMMTYLFPRLLGRDWASRSLCEWHYWLSATGIFIMFLDLTLAGLFQGYFWSSLQPWEASTDGSQPFWITRVFAGLMLFGGFLCFLYNLYLTHQPAPRTARAYSAQSPPAPQAITQSPPSAVLAMFESKSGILFIAGIGFFLFAFLSNGALPMMMFKDLPEKTAEQVVNPRIMTQFRDLADRYPEAFQKAFGEASEAKCAEALRLGRQIYVGEGCWHCHSQFIRPVSNESLRWGPVSKTEEYQNELQRPVMFGTRRVGPDLIREGGRRSNDWHVVHFFRPKTVSADSPMPEYPWFFDATPQANDPKAPKTDELPNLAPNRRGLALITYIQWLGSWQESYPYYEEMNEIKTSE